MIVPYRGRTVDDRFRVEVYRNLNRKDGVWYSVRQSGKVVGHTQCLDLTSCYFIVKEAGRQRVLRTGRKNVHAYVSGHVSAKKMNWANGGEELSAKYNPRESSRFMVVDPDTGCYSPIICALAARVSAIGLTVWGPRA